MSNNLTELVFILDKSGSMAGLELDTIGGFNGMIKSQKNEPGRSLVSTILFSASSDVIHDRVPIEKVSGLSEKDYCVGGSTALVDAVGLAIHHIGNVHKYVRNEDIPEKTVFIITTDGMENSSHIYQFTEVKKMIERRQKENDWEFIFFGANMDAIETAGSFGISPQRAVRFCNDRRGIAINYETINRTIHQMRTNKTVKDDWKLMVEDDYIRRRWLKTGQK